MGNVQCLEASSVYDKDFQIGVKTTSGDSAATDDDGVFTVHITDPPQRCILEPSMVMNVFVDQAEALIRRKELTILDDSSSLIERTVIETDSSAISVPDNDYGDVPSSITTSMRTTAVQAATPANRAKRLEDTSPALLGSDGSTTSNFLRHDIISFLWQHHIETESVLCKHSCIMTPCADLFLNPSYADAVKAHTRVLHLKIIPHCSHFYHKYMTQLLPDNPVTRAISNGIVQTDLSPPRNRADNLPVVAQSESVPSDNHATFVGKGPPSSPIFLLATDSVFMDLAITGSLGLVDRQKFRNLKDCMRFNSHLKSPEHYMVLLNQRSGVPVMVCALKATCTGPPVVRLFATKRRVYGQREAADTSKLGLDWCESLPLYTWAEIVTQGRYPDRIRYSIFMATGSDGRFEITPSYCAVHETSGSPEIKVVGRTERESYHSGCAVLSMCKDDDCSTDDSEAFFRLSISRGIDPALLICFAAFVDESLEKTMRMQCQS